MPALPSASRGWVNACAANGAGLDQRGARIEVSFVVAPDGEIRSARGTIGGALAECIATRVVGTRLRGVAFDSPTMVTLRASLLR